MSACRPVEIRDSKGQYQWANCHPGLAWVPSDDAGTQLSPVSVETFGHVLRAAAFVRMERGLAPWSCIVLNVCHSAELAGRCA